MLVSRKSQLTGVVSTMDLNVTEQQMNAYLSGQNLIQRIFPNLSAPEREFIKTGITPQEWIDIFGTGE